MKQMTNEVVVVVISVRDEKKGEQCDNVSDALAKQDKNTKPKHKKHNEIAFSSNVIFRCENNVTCFAAK